MTLRLRCIDGLPAGLAGGEVVSARLPEATAPLVVAPGTAAARRKIKILTGDDFWPFTDKAMPGGGSLAEVVNAAMEAADPAQGFAIHWVDDWTAHHEPLLSNALLDIGFPWFRPDCDADPETYRCANLIFSESMFEVLMLLFVDKARPFAFNSDADMQGRVLCRPSGYSIYIFDQHGRNWLRDGVITLETAASPGECLRLLPDRGSRDQADLSGDPQLRERRQECPRMVCSLQPVRHSV